MNATLTNVTLSSMNDLPSLFTIFSQIVNLLVGFPLNCYIIKLLFTRDGGLDVSVIFALNLSISEIIYCTTAPITILCFVTGQAFLLKPLGFFLGYCMSARPLFQCCVCVERYIAVVRPITYLKYKSLKYRLMCALGVWMCALSLGIVYMVYFPSMPHIGFGIMYTIILIIDVFCCISILKVLQRPRPGECQVKEAAMNTAKKKAFELVSINLLTLLVQSIPFSAVCGLQNSFSSLFEFSVAISIALTININLCPKRSAAQRAVRGFDALLKDTSVMSCPGIEPATFRSQDQIFTIRQ